MAREPLGMDHTDANIVINALQASHTSTLDALAASAGAGYGDVPRRTPNLVQARANREYLDRIERMLKELGAPSNGERREKTEKYFNSQIRLWKGRYK